MAYKVLLYSNTRRRIPPRYVSIDNGSYTFSITCSYTQRKIDLEPNAPQVVLNPRTDPEAVDTRDEI